ncbi:MAG TPA: patatin-like phospholipase family protein [Acidobacteriaceae bacterium]
MAIARPFVCSCFALLLALTVAATAQQPNSRQQSSPPQAEPAMPTVRLPNGHAGLTSLIDNTMVKTDSAPAGALPPVVPAGRPSIGLVLDGGGALGLAHIGVLKWFEENRIPVDRIAGTSMGSLIGALYATGRSSEEIEDVATGAELPNIFHLSVDYDQLSYRRREDRRELPGAIEVGLKDGISLRNSLLTDRGLNAFLHDEFHSYDGDRLRFDQLPIPFRCVSTDLNTLHKVIFYGGSIPLAVRASIAIPGIFAPVKYANHYLVDGAIMENLPTEVAKNDLRSDVVIAVLLPSTEFTDRDVASVVGVFARAFAAGTARNERESVKLANVLVTPETGKYGIGDYSKAKELIDVGYAAANAQREMLLKYQLSPEAWKQYLADKDARRRQHPGRLETVKIEGGSTGAKESVSESLTPLEGKPIEPRPIIHALSRVQNNQTYEAEFVTLAPRRPNGTTAPGPDNGVLVSLEPTRNGPPFLLLGGDVAAMTGNVTRGTLDLRLINNDFGGYRSELRSDLRVGFLTEASTEYYRLLRPDGLFVQPHAGLLRQPVYIFSDQHRIAERLQQNAGGGLDFGRTYGSRAQLAAEWRYEQVRWRTQSGDDFRPDLSGTAQSGVLHFTYNSLNAGQLATRGVLFDVAGGALYHSLASQNAPVAHLSTMYVRDFADKNIVGFGISADTYFRRNVADPLRFTLGGPLRLSASSIDEYRGTDDMLVRAAYLRRVASLPTQLGDGLYITGAYEGGEIWSPEQPAILRQDGVLGVLAATPLGSITLGGAVGDAGRRKFFFTFGRLF